MSNELYQLPAYRLAEMLRNKEVSAVEISKAAFSRIEKVDGAVGAHLALSEESALETAAEVDKAIGAGEELPPCAGIPVGVKDNISTQGIKTTCASKMLEGYVPPFDAFAVKKLKEQKAVITGKLNMDEFAMGSSTENSYFKPAHNPRDLSRVPGGSSGGSAAAVAAGEVPLSLGSDTGGSIRQPAAYCGVVGLKPTYGSVSRYGLVAFASSLDQIGPLGRNVRDTAMLYSAICGHDPMDATSVKREYPDFSAGLKGDVKGLRVGVPEEYFGAGIDDGVKANVMGAIKELERAGAEIKTISLPSNEYAISAYYILSSAEASSNLARYDGVKYGYRAGEYDSLTDMYEKTRSEGFGAEVKRRIMLGTFVLSSGYYNAYYGKAKRLQQRIYREFAEAFETVDVIATPTAPTAAFKLGQKINDPLEMYMNDICTVTVNIAGLPAISLPCGMAEGLPAGLQLIGNRFSEGTLFKAALGYEEISGGFPGAAEIG